MYGLGPFVAQNSGFTGYDVRMRFEWCRWKGLALTKQNHTRLMSLMHARHLQNYFLYKTGTDSFWHPKTAEAGSIGDK